MTDLIELLGKAVVPVAVGVGFALARKYVKPSARLSELQLSALDDRFRQTKWMVGISVVAVGVVFVWTTHYILVSLNNLFAATDGPLTSFRLWPQTAIWWFFPGVGALALSWEITLQLWSIFGRAGNAMSYRLWSDGRAGFDSTRILRWMALVIAAPIGVSTALALPMHTALGCRSGKQIPRWIFLNRILQARGRELTTGPQLGNCRKINCAQTVIAIARLLQPCVVFDKTTENKWRKRVGVEPTGDIVDATHRF